MKKIFALFLALVMLFSFAACGSKGAEAEATAPEVKTVGIVIPNETLWSADAEYMTAQLQKDGYDVMLFNSQDDAAKQVQDIAELIRAEVDLMIVNPVDGSQLKKVVDIAAVAEIPVIAYDGLIENSAGVSYYVSGENYETGKLYATYLETALDLGNAEDAVYHVEFMLGDTEESGVRAIYQGAYDALQPYFESGVLKVGSGMTEADQLAAASKDAFAARDAMQEILKTYYAGTQLDAVICYDDAVALGVSQAIFTGYNGSNKPLVTGRGGDIANLSNIVDGAQAMTVYQDKGLAADAVLEVAKTILEGSAPADQLAMGYRASKVSNGEASTPAYIRNSFAVTKEDMQKLVDTGLYAWSGEYLILAD